MIRYNYFRKNNISKIIPRFLFSYNQRDIIFKKIGVLPP
jgi:hypothetical protein